MRFSHRWVNVIFLTFWVGLPLQYGWDGDTVRLPTFGNDHRKIYSYCRETLELALFADDPEKQLQEKMLHRAMDSINQRYGEFTLSPARLLQRFDMPNVIAPAWKPDGHRQTV